MRFCINNEQTGFVDFVYAENSFTGARTLLYGGVPLKKISKTHFAFTRDEAVFLDDGIKPLYGDFYLKGNMFKGISVASTSISDAIVVVRPLRFWEIVCAVLPIVFAVAAVVLGLLLGNGASGWFSYMSGVLAVGTGWLGMACNSIIFRTGRNRILNAVIAVEVCILAWLISFLMGYLFGLT